MKKFNFGLQKVIRHREILEDLAQADLMTAQVEYNNQIKKFDLLEDSIKAAKAQRAATLAQGGQSISSLQQIEEFVKCQTILLGKQWLKVQEAEKEVESKREILRIKAQEVKIIEKLKEQRKAEHQEEFDKEEQNDMDERASLRFKSQDEDAE